MTGTKNTYVPMALVDCGSVVARTLGPDGGAAETPSGHKSASTLVDSNTNNSSAD